MNTETQTTDPITKETIDGYIKRHTKDATSEKAAAVLDTAQRARALGFTSTSNSRLAQFWEDIVPPKELAAHYEEHYPACYFLTWIGLRRVLETMKLKFDLPAFYAGAIPNDQLLKLELFERRDEDRPMAEDFSDCVYEDGDKKAVAHFLAARELGDQAALMQMESGAGLAMRNMLMWEAQRRMGSGNEAIERVKGHVQEFRDSMFVAAPEGAFTTGDRDWIARVRENIDAATEPVPAPPDPLVVSPVKNGVLVVAAWGDEAEAINELANELGV